MQNRQHVSSFQQKPSAFESCFDLTGGKRSKFLDVVTKSPLATIANIYIYIEYIIHIMSRNLQSYSAMQYSPHLLPFNSWSPNQVNECMVEHVTKVASKMMHQQPVPILMHMYKRMYVDTTG